jgi:hexosaminidase
MIPSVKNLTKGAGEVTVPKQLAIKPQAGFETEAKLLGERLAKLYGAQITADATFVITIGELTGDAAVNDEAYCVALQPNGVQILGATPQGASHGAHTFANLLRGAQLPATLDELTITDYPDFGYRGVMIDVSRNFIKKENILKLLDLFADYKINTLHFHLTDDEGWRIEIPGIEELTTVGAHRGHTLDESQWLYPAYGSGPSASDPNSAGNGFYTRQDFIDILRYATDRHIRVVPEIDVPGHSRAAIRATKARYNTYIATDSVKANEYMLFDPTDKSKYHSAQDYTDCALSVALPATYRFIDKVMGELKAMYDEAGAPIDQVHIGGDEVPHGAWTDAPRVAELMAREGIKDSKGLNDYFFRHAGDILKKHGLKMSGWQELIFDHGAEVKESNVGNPAGYGNVYCWSTMGNYDVIPYNAANAGYDIILCNVTNLYLDLSYNRHQSEPGLHWGGYTDEVKGFDVQPYNLYSSLREDADGNARDLSKAADGKPALKPENRGRIKGMQGQLWAETVTEFPRTEYMLFPKIFGLSERSWNANPAWSTLKGAQADAAYSNDLSKFYNTLTQRELPYLSTQEVNYRVNQPGFKVEEGKVVFNAIDPNAEIYYTLDGTVPTTASARYDGTPVSLPSADAPIRAIAVVRGKQSVVTR